MHSHRVICKHNILVNLITIINLSLTKMQRTASSFIQTNASIVHICCCYADYTYAVIKWSLWKKKVGFYCYIGSIYGHLMNYDKCDYRDEFLRIFQLILQANFAPEVILDILAQNMYLTAVITLFCHFSHA